MAVKRGEGRGHPRLAPVRWRRRRSASAPGGATLATRRLARWLGVALKTCRGARQRRAVDAPASTCARIDMRPLARPRLTCLGEEERLGERLGEGPDLLRLA